jgi:hypothetical protein
MRVMKKTIEVKGMVEWANTQLARTDEYADVGFKSGISTMIERILHNTNNYHGFMFINNDDSECGTLGYYSRTYFYHN